MMSPCLSDLASYVTHAANGICGPPPSGAWAPLGLFLLGALGTLALWSRRSRTAIFLCVLFALPGWWTIAQRHIDEEPVARLRAAVEAFAESHDRCVTIDARGCEACEPIAWRARTPSRPCAHPAVVELHAGALGGHCRQDGDRLLCDPN